MTLDTQAKTVADCFKYRNKLGTDVSIRALREAVREKNVSPDELLRFVDICRVRHVMVPYLECVVHWAQGESDYSAVILNLPVDH